MSGPLWLAIHNRASFNDTNDTTLLCADLLTETSLKAFWIAGLRIRWIRCIIYYASRLMQPTLPPNLCGVGMTVSTVSFRKHKSQVTRHEVLEGYSKGA